MKFEREKVVDVLCDNLEQWVGCEGYFADYLTDLKKNVEDEDGLYTMVGTIDCACPFETMSGMNYQFFYPVTPPEKERKLVPFDTCQELIDWYCERKVSQPPLIWTKHKTVKDRVCIIVAFDGDEVTVGQYKYTLADLFKDFTLLDGTPIGKEIEK